jgi:hypothetical protein
MQAYQWFLLGMLVAWTPGLIVLAVMLRQASAALSEIETKNGERPIARPRAIAESW